MCISDRGIVENDAGHTPTGANPRHFKIDPSGEWMVVDRLAAEGACCPAPENHPGIKSFNSPPVFVGVCVSCNGFVPGEGSVEVYKLDDQGV